MTALGLTPRLADKNKNSYHRAEYVVEVVARFGQRDGGTDEHSQRRVLGASFGSSRSVRSGLSGWDSAFWLAHGALMALLPPATDSVDAPATLI